MFCAFFFISLLSITTQAKVNPCADITGQKELILSGTTHGGENEVEQDPFEIYVTLNQGGGGTLFQVGLEGRSPITSRDFDELVFSSPLLASGSYSETVEDLRDLSARAMKYLRIFDQAFREGGDASLKFLKSGDQGEKAEVGHLASIRGQKNAFKGFLKSEVESQTKRLDFFSIPYNNMITLSLPVLVQGELADLSINLFDQTIVLRTSRQTKTTYFSHYLLHRGINTLRRFVYKERSLKNLGQSPEDLITDVFTDLFSERLSEIRFFALDEIVLELRNFSDIEAIGTQVTGSLFPGRQVHKLSFKAL